MTREEAARFPYGSAGAAAAAEERPNIALIAELDTLRAQVWYLRRELDNAMDKLTNPTNPYRGAL